MKKRTKIQHIKLFIKISIVICVLFIFVVLGLFVKPGHTFENANMGKWLKLDRQQQIETVQLIIKTDESQELLLDCVTKIAELPKSDDMQIRDAVVLCYNGIKLNTESISETSSESDEK